MKTLIISGSPRRNGDSMMLVKELLKYLEGEVKVIQAYYDNIKPCMDCRFCWNNDGCCVKDDMQEVYKLLDEVDNVIVASPIYFSELTGGLLSFASRFQMIYARRHIRNDSEYKLKEKNGLLILTGGGDGSPDPAIARAKILFRYMNAKLIGIVSSLQTNIIPSKDDSEAMDKLKKYTGELNKR